MKSNFEKGTKSLHNIISCQISSDIKKRIIFKEDHETFKGESISKTLEEEEPKLYTNVLRIRKYMTL